MTKRPEYIILWDEFDNIPLSRQDDTYGERRGPYYMGKWVKEFECYQVIGEFYSKFLADKMLEELNGK